MADDISHIGVRDFAARNKLGVRNSIEQIRWYRIGQFQGQWLQSQWLLMLYLTLRVVFLKHKI